MNARDTAKRKTNHDRNVITTACETQDLPVRREPNSSWSPHPLSSCPGSPDGQAHRQAHLPGNRSESPQTQTHGERSPRGLVLTCTGRSQRLYGAWPGLVPDGFVIGQASKTAPSSCPGTALVVGRCLTGLSRLSAQTPVDSKFINELDASVIHDSHLPLTPTSRCCWAPSALLSKQPDPFSSQIPFSYPEPRALVSAESLCHVPQSSAPVPSNHGVSTAHHTPVLCPTFFSFI